MRLKYVIHVMLLSVLFFGVSARCSSSPTNTTVITSAGHSDRIGSIVFSPDGRWFATASADASIKLWDTATGQILRTLTGHASEVGVVRVSANGKFLVSVANDDTMRIWDVVTGECVREVKDFHLGYVTATKLVLGKDGSSVELIVRPQNFGGKELIRRYNIPSGLMVGPEAPSNGDNEAIARNPDGSQLAIAAKDETGKGRSISIVDEATGHVLRKIQSAHSRYLHTIAWSPNGQQIASGGDDQTVKLWDAASLVLQRTLSFSAYVHSVAYSPNSQYLATASYLDGVQLWTTGDGRLIRNFGNLKSFASAISFSPDGKLLVSSDDDKGLSIWEVESGNLIRRQPQDHYHNASVVRSLSDDTFRSVGQGSIADWDLTNGNLISSQAFETSNIKSIQLSSDPQGQIVAATPEKSTKINVWDANSSRLLQTFDWGPVGGNDGDIPTIVLSSNGRYMAATTHEKGTLIKVWDVVAGKLIRAIPGHSTVLWPETIALSADGTLLSSSGFLKKNGSSIRITNVASGKLLKTIGQDDPSKAMSFAADRAHLFADGYVNKDEILYYDLGGMSPPRPLGGFGQNRTRMISPSPDGKTIAIAWDRTSTIEIREVTSGRTLLTLDQNVGLPRSIAFTPSGSRLIVGNANGSISIWNLNGGDLLATIVQGEGGDWLTITPEGFFTASEHGASIAHVVNGLTVLEIGQFYQALFRPDLVREKLAGDPKGLVREAASRLDLNKAIASGSAPELSVSIPTRSIGAGSTDTLFTAVAEIFDKGGGIGRVEWRVNGVTAGIDTPTVSLPGQSVRLRRNLSLDNGENTIEVVAYNGANLIASVPAQASIAVQLASPSVPSQPTAPSATSESNVPAKPRLFLLVAGVNEYADKRFRLSYAVSDAKDIADGFKEASGSLYQSVEVKLLTDADVTLDKLDAAFAELAGKAAASDVFVLYLAGHGKTVDGRYYFVPQDFAIQGELSDKIINDAVKAKAISQEQWQRWFAQIPARRSVMLFDTCESGTLADDETQQLQKGAANERLVQATGRSILAASGGSQEALEGFHGHGLFTYEVLDAINEADGDRNGTVELNELAAYVYAQVSEVSQRIFKQRQVPQMKLTANYTLAKKMRILQNEETPIAAAKPTYQVLQVAQLHVQPGLGASVLRSLSAKTGVTVLDSKNGWSLIASEGKPLGYIATRDLAPVP